KPGKYEIEKGTSILSLLRRLRNGKQTPVNLVITKLRTKEDFAKLTGNKFEFDSTDMITFLANADSLKEFDVDTANAMSIVLPDTYTYFWNTTPQTVLQKLFNASKKFWTEERIKKAASQNLSPTQAHTLASIIEEETTNHAEKDTIASVYLNRLKIGMPLQADPTLKFAVRNFALKRIAGDILNVQSPYNTYRVKGLPPGPISTPSKITIDKVLNAATTNFLYFVAKPRLGGHLFSATYEEHLSKRDDYLAADKKRRDSAQ
ncbi:MAG: endolytic transglycosylase MltG, partial [Bacteroidota bacterium]